MIFSWGVQQSCVWSLWILVHTVNTNAANFIWFTLTTLGFLILVASDNERMLGPLLFLIMQFGIQTPIAANHLVSQANRDTLVFILGLILGPTMFFLFIVIAGPPETHLSLILEANTLSMGFHLLVLILSYRKGSKEMTVKFCAGYLYPQFTDAFVRAYDFWFLWQFATDLELCALVQIPYFAFQELQGRFFYTSYQTSQWPLLRTVTLLPLLTRPLFNELGLAVELPSMHPVSMPYFLELRAVLATYSLLMNVAEIKAIFSRGFVHPRLSGLGSVL